MSGRSSDRSKRIRRFRRYAQQLCGQMGLRLNLIACSASGGNYDLKTRTVNIMIGHDSSIDLLYSILFHETQHALDHRDGRHARYFRGCSGLLRTETGDDLRWIIRNGLRVERWTDRAAAKRLKAAGLKGIRYQSKYDQPYYQNKYRRQYLDWHRKRLRRHQRYRRDAVNDILRWLCRIEPDMKTPIK